MEGRRVSSQGTEPGADPVPTGYHKQKSDPTPAGPREERLVEMLRTSRRVFKAYARIHLEKEMHLHKFIEKWQFSLGLWESDDAIGSIRRQGSR